MSITGYINWVPVEFCSKSIVELGQNWEKHNHLIFHGVNIRGNTSWDLIVKSIISFGYKLEAVDDDEFMNHLESKSNENSILKSLKGVISSRRFKSHFNPKYETTNICNELDDDIKNTCVEISEEVIHTYIKYFIVGMINEN